MVAIVRPEEHANYGPIAKINQLAFGGVQEARLVEALRARPDYIRGLSLVAQLETKIVGHVLFFPVRIVGQGVEHSALSLAPLAVHPDYQNLGIGTQLVRNGLERSERMGYNFVVVLGHPGYYARFGFERASNYGIYPPFEAADDAYMVWTPSSNLLKGVSGRVVYPPEFDGL